MKLKHSARALPRFSFSCSNTDTLHSWRRSVVHRTKSHRHAYLPSDAAALGQQATPSRQALSIVKHHPTETSAQQKYQAYRASDLNVDVYDHENVAPSRASKYVSNALPLPPSPKYPTIFSGLCSLPSFGLIELKS